MRKENVNVKNVKTINVKTGEVKQSRVETTTLDERPNIWNLQAFVIVFLFIMLATTINVYSVNNDNLTWVDINGDFKLDSYNHSMINLDTDLLELNNQSLNEVFLDGNLFTSFNVTNVNALYSINNDILTITDNTNSFQYLSIFNYDGSASINHIFYSVVEFATNDTNSNNRRLRLFDDVSLEYATTTFLKQDINYEYFSVLGEKTQNDLDILVYNSIGAGLQNDDTLIRNVILLDLTNLGIDNLSKAQMDDYYNLYVNLQENRIEAYKDLGNEPISQWQNLTQVLSDIMDAVSGPISDTIDWIDKFMFGLFS